MPINKTLDDTDQNARGASRFRWLVLACGALGCFGIGAIYLYGMFQPYIMDYFGIDSAAATTPYTLVWIIFTLGQFVAGPLLKRMGVKASATVGFAVLGGSYVALSLLPPQGFAWFMGIYLVATGLSLGVAYNVVAATVVRWFPDRKGVATSVSIGMMGGSGDSAVPRVRRPVGTGGVPHVLPGPGTAVCTLRFALARRLS